MEIMICARRRGEDSLHVLPTIAVWSRCVRFALLVLDQGVVRGQLNTKIIIEAMPMGNEVDLD
jgi:hypothetical protein